MGGKANLEIQMLNEARAEVALADNKASVILAAAGIGFGAVLGGLLSGDWRPSNYTTEGQVLWWIGAVSAFGVVAFSAAAMWPRFTTKSEDSLVTYWGHVARYTTLPDFEAAVQESEPSRARTRHQLWRLARIVRKKYCLVRCSFVSGAMATVMFFLAGIIG